MTYAHADNDPRKQAIADLTSFLVHKHYCENDVEALIAQLDEDFFWLGAGDQEFAVGKARVSGIFREFVGRVPKCNISDEQYHVLQLSPDVYLCVGRMWISTDASTQVYLRVHQRITTVFRWKGECPRCCHIHISNPYDDMKAEDIGFPSKIAHQSYQYLQEQIALQKKQLAAQTSLLQRMSYEDSLTGLYNRNRFNLLLTDDWVENRMRVGIACFDLNGLKNVNDRLGHSAGDILLRHAADHLRRIFEGKAYRTGGDEFVVVDDELDEAAFRAAVHAVQQGMAEDSIHCSVGISWRDAHCSVKEQYDEADQLMYREKRLFYSIAGNDRRKHRD